MPQLLVAFADSRLQGLLGRYVTWHVARCPQCHAALEALLALHDRLETLRKAPAEPLPPELQQALQETLPPQDSR
jgi:RecB family exonuclease